MRIGLIAERVRKIEWEIRNTKPSDHDSELALRKDLVGGLLDSLNVDSLVSAFIPSHVLEKTVVIHIFNFIDRAGTNTTSRFGRRKGKRQLRGG